MKHLAAVLLLSLPACATTGHLGIKEPTALKVYGVQADGPAVIRTVTEADNPLQVGDTILSIGGQRVTAFSYFNRYGPSATVEARKANGSQVKMAYSRLLRSEGNGLGVLTIGPGQVMVFSQRISSYERTQTAGLMLFGRETALVSASLWQTEPRILEVYIDIRAPESCTTCSLTNLGVMDRSRKAWLTPVPASKVAWVVVPPVGAAPPPMNVPPPTPVGSVTTTTSTGTLNGATYGNSFYGNYSGVASSTTTPYYDYTLTNMALAYNLAAAIQQNRIVQSNRARKGFVVDRIGNLHLGAMTPGERETGYIDFVVPNDFDGPFVVSALSGKRFAAVRFDEP